MSESLVLIIAAYNRSHRAEAVFPDIEKLNNKGKIDILAGATVVKDYQGKTTVQSTMEIARKKGTRYGALAGGLLAVIAPPVGVAGLLLGTAAGAVVGRKISNKPDKGLSTELIHDIQDHLSADSSAIVIISEESKSENVITTLNGYGGDVFRHVLSTEAIEKLVSTNQEDVAVVASPEQQARADEVRRLLSEKTRRTGPVFKKVLVIANPASGKDEPILNTLNSIFRPAGLEWDIKITKKAGDAARLAREAAEAGFDVVAIYGGDGSVMEAASGLSGTDTPLAILPGGTNNVMSVELGIPRPLIEAAALISTLPAKIIPVDMGKCNDHEFILRVGVGYEAVINELADREMKDRFGGLAYTLAGMKALTDPPVANYKLTLDGHVEELEGLWVMVANSASMGSESLNLVQNTSVSDGLLDVIVVRRADLQSLVSVVGSMAKIERVGKPLPHWQVKEVTVEADPPMAVTGDGEIWENTPLKLSVVPSAVRILVPDNTED